MTFAQSETFSLDDLKISNPKATIPHIKEGTYPINKATVISIPALEEIKEMLRNRLMTEDPYGICRITDKELHQLMDEIGTEWVTKQGNWPKRFAKIFKHRRGQKFSNDFLSRVGKVARESCFDSTGRELIITQEFSWDPGDYGDDDSCFWGCRAGARELLHNANAYALLIHGEDDRPLGRAWCAPFKEHYVVFNTYACYGESITMTAFARILSDIFNFSYYRNVRLTCRGRDNGPLWINGSKGYVVGSQDVSTIEHIDLDYRLYCSNCEDECVQEAHLDDDDNILCEHCYEGSHVCDGCGRRVHDDDVCYVNDTPVCPRCFDRSAFTCYECGESDWNDNAHEHNGNSYCEYCFHKYYAYCQCCDETVEKDKAVEVTEKYGIMTYCVDCFEEYGFTCEECGEAFIDSMQSDNEGICVNCYKVPEKEETA